MPRSTALLRRVVKMSKYINFNGSLLVILFTIIIIIYVQTYSNEQISTHYREIERERGRGTKSSRTIGLLIGCAHSTTISILLFPKRVKLWLHFLFFCFYIFSLDCLNADCLADDHTLYTLWRHHRCLTHLTSFTFNNCTRKAFTN